MTDQVPQPVEPACCYCLGRSQNVSVCIACKTKFDMLSIENAMLKRDLERARKSYLAASSANARLRRRP